jgi:hypothetical protein
MAASRRAELLKHLESRYHPSEARPVGKPGQLSADLMRRLVPEIKDKQDKQDKLP